MTRAPVTVGSARRRAALTTEGALHLERFLSGDLEEENRRMPLWLGTSGWQYQHWNGAFYPADLPARDQLRHYAARFAFFNNDLHGCALRDAVRLARAAAERGLAPTRVPELSATPVK
jgi:hypothetical protein